MPGKRKKISLAKRRSEPPKHEEKRKAKKAQSLFEMMRVLSAEQRQRFADLRRKWKAKPGVKEKIEEAGEGWVVRYYKGKKVLAEARFGPQQLDFTVF